MSLAPKTMPFISRAGIQRDITKAQSPYYLDGQWMRFYNDLPRKMGGYLAIDLGNLEIIRSMFAVESSNALTAYLGRGSSLAFITIDQLGQPGLENDRTPTGFASDPDNTWSMDLFTSTLSGLQQYIVAVAAPNASDISNETEGIIYYGDVSTNTALIPVPNAPTVSGGVVATGPLLVAYGNGGVLNWCDPGDITEWGTPDANFAVIDNTKIVKAMNTRGGGNPTLLCWSLNKLIRATYVSTLDTFIADVIEPNISILSPASVVTYQTVTYWIGNNNFYSYTGIVNIIPNTMNADWFFQNLNREAQSKIFGIVNNRFGEIWWYFPFGDSTECNAVIILQPAKLCWYDSQSNRSAGLSDDIIPYPLLADNQTVATNTGTSTIFTYPLWLHEYGVDKVILDNTYAIDSYFKSHFYNLVAMGVNQNMRSRRLELDFNQSGDMTIVVLNRQFMKSIPIPSGPYTFSETDVKIDDIATQGVYVSFVVRSNVAGGYYQQGNPLLHWEIGDARR